MVMAENGKTWVLIFLALAVVVGWWGCTPAGERGLEGTVLFQNRPLADARVEIYLKADKDRSVQPFAVGRTDAQGRYRIALPPGRYFVIGRKRSVSDHGRVRMLMAEAPGNPYDVAGGMSAIASFNLREMGREGLPAAGPETGVQGRVVFRNQPVSRAYVYVYTDVDSELTGPSYGEAVQTDAEGRFTIDLPAGRYALVARKRADGGRSGGLSPGDLNGNYPGNPVTVQRGLRRDLGDLKLMPIDAGVHARRQAAGVFAKTDTRLHGRVVDPTGRPVKDIHVFAYLDSRMLGKPAHMSVPTDAAGRFELFVREGGTYYVGARSAYGGPLEPGEWVGTYNGRADHGVDLHPGDNQDLGTIAVREFW